MEKQFGERSTTDEVLAGVSLRGTRILVTGVSSGLGLETARALVAHGADVVGAVRDLEKAKQGTSEIHEIAAESGGSLDFLELDLASLKSVRNAADKLVGNGRMFDVVIANAGVMATPFGKTEDGFETQFGTNHLGHFVFVNRIARLMRDGGRLVNLSSNGHRFGNVSLNDPNFDTPPYDPFLAYGRSKTALILFAVEFDRRHRDRGVRATAVHPGVIRTDLGRHMPEEVVKGFIEQLQKERAAAGEAPFELKSIPQGAATSIWAGVVASGDEVGGNYCEDCQVGQVLSGDAKVSSTSRGVSSYALDPETARGLWTKSEEMVGEAFA